MKPALSLFLIAAIALPAWAHPLGTLHYSCDLDGVAGELTGEYEIIDATGAPHTPDAGLSELVGVGASRVFYNGQLSTPSGKYVFTGENQFAEFTDLATHERFIVRMIAEGPQLQLTANPNGAVQTHYLCQSSQ
ncbi:hypothetical protein [Henriciella aquimarina]|uniref:hypothetical protein n=1 Tax=Henriciella aquimarina TaxID=545261 RepID=UPI000A029D22|nr:hypothetical protein [Henriciella aquimarina]